MSEVLTPLGSPLPSGWGLRALGPMCTKIGSGATPRGGSAVYRDSGTAFIRSQNVFDHYFSDKGLARIDDQAAQKLSLVTVQHGDVLLNITGDGDTIARCCLVPDRVLPARVNQHVLIIRTRPNELLPGFLQRYLSHPKIRNYMLNHNSGGSRRALTKGHAEGFEIVVPPLSTQRAITEVLGALDSEIEANRTTIYRAERLATAIPTVAPEVTTIESVASISRKGVSTTFFANGDVEHFSLPAFDAGARPIFEAGDAIKSGKNLLEGPTVLVSKLNPRIPRVWMAVPTGTFPAVASTEFIGLTPVGDHSVEVLWALCNAPGFSSQLGEKVKGTTGSHQRVAPEDVLTIEVPDPRLLDQSATTTITAAVELAGALRRESSRLTDLRDVLLLKLLSGEIRIRDAETLVEDAV